MSARATKAPGRSSMLGGDPWVLHDVRDVEALCRRTVGRRLRSWNATLNPLDLEDLLDAMVTVCWELSERYDPAFGQRFSTYASKIIERRIVDWYRTRFGDGRYGSSPELISLEDLVEEENDAGSTWESVMVEATTVDEVMFRVAIGH